MIINVYSLKNAIDIIETNNKNWISIRDANFNHIYKPIDDYANNLLTLTFDDVTHYHEKNNMLHPFYTKLKRDLIHFDYSMAEQIKEFSDIIFNNNESINIHCYAGQSRSQAIGTFLNNYYNLFLDNNVDDYLINIKNNVHDKFMPNFDVTKILYKTFY
jgi:predicted protein tyrosine phosphatase